MTTDLDRRRLFGIAGAALAGGYVAAPRPAAAIPPVKGQIPADPVKFSFGYLVNQGEFELSERAWENLETPKAEEETYTERLLKAKKQAKGQ